MIADREHENAERDSQTYAIIGSAMEVHRHLGPGLLESVYQEALARELDERGVPFRREVELPIHYKGRLLPCSYRADFVCFDSVIVELKALNELSSREQAQVINYLKATRLPRTLLINFGASRLEYKRLILSSHLCPSASSADSSSSDSSSSSVNQSVVNQSVPVEVSGG
jgi:GxxExxY protein